MFTRMCILKLLQKRGRESLSDCEEEDLLWQVKNQSNTWKLKENLTGGLKEHTSLDLLSVCNSVKKVFIDINEKGFLQA